MECFPQTMYIQDTTITIPLLNISSISPLPSLVGKIHLNVYTMEP